MGKEYSQSAVLLPAFCNCKHAGVNVQWTFIAVVRNLMELAATRFFRGLVKYLFEPIAFYRDRDGC